MVPHCTARRVVVQRVWFKSTASCFAVHIVFRLALVRRHSIWTAKHVPVARNTVTAPRNFSPYSHGASLYSETCCGAASIVKSTASCFAVHIVFRLAVVRLHSIGTEKHVPVAQNTVTAPRNISPNSQAASLYSETCCGAASLVQEDSQMFR